MLSFASSLRQFLEKRQDTIPSSGAVTSLPDGVLFREDLTDLPVKTEGPTTGSSGQEGPDLFSVDNRIPALTPRVSLAEVSSMFKERFGYSLHVSESSIDHPDAGLGLWLSGTVQPGHIVAIFPGVTYDPVHYKYMDRSRRCCEFLFSLREMLGYPKIDRDNPYLASRFDGVIVDSKPWGMGLYEHNDFEGTTQTFSEVYELEGRHPLAFAHFANHPPKGTQPNVRLAPLDIQTDETSRAYVPNVKCMGKYAVIDPDEVVRGLVLLADRRLEDEEIFRNYRLNPATIRPSWYCPVDAKEDMMRWS